MEGAHSSSVLKRELNLKVEPIYQAPGEIFYDMWLLDYSLALARLLHGKARKLIREFYIELKMKLFQRSVS